MSLTHLQLDPLRRELKDLAAVVHRHDSAAVLGLAAQPPSWGATATTPGRKRNFLRRNLHPHDVHHQAMERPLTLQWSPVNQDSHAAPAVVDARPPPATMRLTETPTDSTAASTNPSDDEGKAVSKTVDDPDLTEDEDDVKDGAAGGSKKKKWTKLTDDDYILVIKLCCSYGDLYGKVSDKAFYQTVRKEYGDITGKRPPGARAIQYRLNKLTTEWQRIFGEDEHARHMNRIEMAVREWVLIVQARSEKDKQERETTERLLQKNERHVKERLAADQLDAKRIRSHDDGPDSKRLKTADDDVVTRTKSHSSARSADDIKHLREYFDAKIDRIMNLLEDLAKRIG